MRAIVNKSRIMARIRVPSSKSLTIRALMCAALAEGESEILYPLVAEDTDAATAVLEKLGVDINKEENVWKVGGGYLRASGDELYCGESAATLRFLTAICAVIPGKHYLTGGTSLSRRPIGTLIKALQDAGIKCSAEGTTPRVTVEGGILDGGEVGLPGNVSSQFITALLLVAPFARKEMSINITTPLMSRPYVAMTLDVLDRFGIEVMEEIDRFVVSPQKYHPTSIEIEGDWSSASCLLALGAVSDAIEVEGLNPESYQGDRVLLDFLDTMGAVVKVSKDHIVVSRGDLRAIDADFADCIDLLPVMAVLAALAEGESVFTGISRARLKESDRVAAVKSGLETLGVGVEVNEDTLVINGVGVEGLRTPAVIDSYDDHRITMAFSIIGVVAGDVTINGAESVNKTFPGYWEALKSVGGDIKLYAK